MTTGRRTAVIVALAMMILAGCGQGTVEAGPEAPAAVSEPIPGSDLLRLTLTASAVERLAIETAPVVAEGEDLVIPYGALLYDEEGGAWAYVDTEPLVYERAPLEVDRIEGDRVILSDGPDPGTLVVTVGAAELYGVESGVGGGH